MVASGLASAPPKRWVVDSTPAGGTRTIVYGHLSESPNVTKTLRLPGLSRTFPSSIVRSSVARSGLQVWGIVRLNGCGSPNVGLMGFLCDARIRAAKPKDKAHKLFDSQGLYLKVSTSGGAALAGVAFVPRFTCDRSSVETGSPRLRPSV
jgi:hypothetical protein